MPTKAQLAGGKATAAIFRKMALDKYYSNPCKCTSCGNVIKVRERQKVRVARKRKFCSLSCAAKFNNSKRPRKIVVKHVAPRASVFSGLEKLTKGGLFESYKNYQSARSRIQKHARHVYFSSGMPKRCFCCGYEKHIEICHLRAVSDFPGDSSIVSDINAPANLVALCPTHHWEFDNELISVGKRLQKKKGL